ncbi:ArsR/SmtB family transcription factor, partial [Halorubrum pallidum]
MDSAVLLDLLGNENRRRILRLLATKPCYVTEISEYLDVSPKAVIDHLRKLEEAGLIESTTDDQRRKYFRITRSLRLEVSVSPYGFGAKSAYPAKSSLDMSGRCPHLSIELSDGSGVGPSTELADLADEFARLQDLDRELSLAQRWVQGRVEDTLSRIDDRLGTEADSRFFAAVLAALIETDGTP